MTTKEIISRKRRLEQAIKDNRNLIENSKKPHEKDIARYRINILKVKLKELENMIYAKK